MVRVICGVDGDGVSRGDGGVLNWVELGGWDAWGGCEDSEQNFRTFF